MDMHFPAGTNAGTIIMEARQYAPLLVDGISSRVLDVGAHIGAFARLAYPRQTLCVEPDSRNLQYLRMNVPDALIVPGALTDHPEMLQRGFAYLRQTLNTDACRLFPEEYPETVPVYVYSFWGLVVWYKPNVIKVDAEGSEQHFDFHQLPDSVRRMFVEWHPYEKVDFSELKRNHGVIVQQGFKADWEPHPDRCIGSFYSR